MLVDPVESNYYNYDKEENEQTTSTCCFDVLALALTEAKVFVLEDSEKRKNTKQFVGGNELKKDIMKKLGEEETRKELKNYLEKNGEDVDLQRTDNFLSDYQNKMFARRVANTFDVKLISEIYNIKINWREKGNVNWREKGNENEKRKEVKKETFEINLIEIEDGIFLPDNLQKEKGREKIFSRLINPKDCRFDVRYVSHLFGEMELEYKPKVCYLWDLFVLCTQLHKLFAEKSFKNDLVDCLKKNP